MPLAYDHRVLSPADRVEVTIVIDNFLDVLMAGEEGVVRYQARDFGLSEQLVAEHGFSALVTLERDGDRQTVLYDAGLTPHAVARNLDVLGLPVADLRAIVISHGHADHHGGLEGLVRRRGRSRLPLVIHPDAWRERRIVFPSGGELQVGAHVSGTTMIGERVGARLPFGRGSSVTSTASTPRRLPGTVTEPLLVANSTLVGAGC